MFARDPFEPFVIYRAAFPGPHADRPERATPIPEDIRQHLWHMAPTSISPDRLVCNFNAFLAGVGDEVTKAHRDLEDMPDRAPGHDFPCYYRFDGLTWLGTMLIRSSYFDDQYYKEFHFKLPNDGFCYPPSNTFELRRHEHEVAARHRCTGWAEIDHKGEREREQFGRFIDFAQEFYGVQRRRELRVQVFYNYEHMRVDLKFIHVAAKKILFITFEPGYPTEDMDQTLWRPIDDGSDSEDV